MSNHTKGPWVWIEQGSLVGSDGDVLVKNLEGYYGFATFLDGGTEDNMRLVAAAPDLLEALEYCIKQIPEFATVPGIVSAIAKAKGG